MKNLELTDFTKHVDLSNAFNAHFFDTQFEDGTQIVLESCMDGYCVGQYDSENNLIGEKTCTKMGSLNISTLDMRAMALTKAIHIANEMVQHPMQFDRPFKGPEIRWNHDDLKKMVDHFGFDAACERIAEGMFQLDYVKNIANQILTSESDTKTQSFSNEGTI